LHQSRGNVRSHAVVDSTACQDDFGVVTECLSFGGQVVGINTDAVAAHQPRCELQEVPFGAGGLQNLRGANADEIADLRHLVHQGDIDIALRVFQNFRRLGHLDRRGAVHARIDDLLIHAGNDLERLRILARDNLDDILERVLAVAGIDAFRAIAKFEVNAAMQARRLFQLRAANFFRGAGVDGGFEHDNRARLQNRAYRSASVNKQRKIRIVFLVDRRWNGHYEKVAALEL